MSLEVEKINLRRLPLSPLVNPLMGVQSITTKRRFVRSGRRVEELMSTETGEIAALNFIAQVEEKDDAEFVKVFAAGVAASYDLSKAAQRAFQVVLDQYQRSPMSKGYSDHVNLLWYQGGIEGREVGMSEKTFQRGLKELIQKKFLAPKDGVSYWVNASLFFKGDRVIFIKEYRRRSKESQALIDLESAGQLRLIDTPAQPEPLQVQTEQT